jgi:hypothetical protein
MDGWFPGLLFLKMEAVRTSETPLDFLLDYLASLVRRKASLHCYFPSCRRLRAVFSISPLH